VVFLVNYLLSFSRFAQNLWLFIVSIVFYAWGEPVLVLIMLFSIVANTVFGILVDKYRLNAVKVKIILVITCVFNLSFLFVYKYLGFVVQNINGIFGKTLIDFAGFALPLGISFYTFQAMSYVIDVYRKDAKVEKNPFYVGLYVAFFPQLVAGPIVRYTDVAEQIRGRKATWNMVSSGCCRFITGVGKKILISNAMATIADHIFNLSAMSGSETIVPVSLAWLGILAYTLQIYFDFSGYSDMAIGLGRMFGFEFLENFNYPYVADSIVDFWRRWHISLSTWFREYVYFPLGGSRVANNDLMVRNTFIVWLLTGIWHGAEWAFLLWGMWNFAFIMLERIINFGELPIPKVFKHIYSLLIIGIGWMFFRAGDLYQAFLYLRNILGMNSNGFASDITVMFLREYWIFLAAGILFSMPIAPRISQVIKKRAMGNWSAVFNIAYPAVLMLIMIISVTYLAKGSYNPFIYFNF